MNMPKDFSAPLSPVMPLPSMGGKSVEVKEWETVLRHLVYDQPLYEASLEIIAEMDFFRPYPHMGHVYDMLVEYSEDGKMPTRTTYTNYLADYLQKRGVHANDSMDMLELVGAGIGMQVLDVSMDDVHLILLDTYREHIYGKVHRTLESVESVEDLAEFLRENERKLTMNPFKAAKATTFCLDPETALEGMTRSPIGVDALDRMLDGGPAAGELIGYLAPSGGGKSTVGWMAAVATMTQKKRAWYLSTEQRLKGDFSVRVQSLITGESRNAFKHGWKNVPEQIRLKSQEQVTKYEAYSTFLDLTDTEYQSVDAVFDPIRKAFNRGDKPDLIVLDWWGRLNDQINSCNPKITTDPQKRTASRNNLHRLKQIAEDLECPIFVLHQLTGQANKKGSKSKITSADAQEDATFNNMFDFCFVAGNRNGDDVFNLTTDKARGAARTSVDQKLNGAYCRIDDVKEFSKADDLYALKPGESELPVNGQLQSDLMVDGDGMGGSF